jgi:hypothetical protein
VTVWQAVKEFQKQTQNTVSTKPVNSEIKEEGHQHN